MNVIMLFYIKREVFSNFFSTILQPVFETPTGLKFFNSLIISFLAQERTCASWTKNILKIHFIKTLFPKINESITQEKSDKLLKDTACSRNLFLYFTTKKSCLIIWVSQPTVWPCSRSVWAQATQFLASTHTDSIKTN